MTLDFNVELKHFPDNVPLATTAAAIETWLDSLNISAVGAGLVPSGLVLDLPMDEGEGTTVFDRSGNDNDGDLNGCTWVDGKYGNALEFNGTTDYVNCGNDASLNIVDEITIAFWLNPTVAEDELSVVLASQDGWDGGICVRYQQGLVELYYNFEGIRYHLYTTTALTINTWTHCALVFKDPTHIYIYLNGIDKSGVISSASVAHVFQELVIGAFGTTHDYNFQGVIDGVRIYNRALTLLEIKKLYYDRFQDRQHKIKIQRKYGFYEVKVIYV